MSSAAPSSLFVTGTDTGVGKTLVACALLRRWQRRGALAIGMKPVAAGRDAAGRNEDVDALRAASSADLASRLSDRQINPYAFAPPIAPHLAAAEAGVDIGFAPILSAYAVLASQATAIVVEGVGGFRVPLGGDGDSADLAVALGLPVVLVVGLRLGCLNHALLTEEAIRARGLALAGWVANRIDPQMRRAEDNLDSLRQRLAAPLLGSLPFMAGPDAELAAERLRLPDEIAAPPRTA
jgi:dethiobiotin synthetase